MKKIFIFFLLIMLMFSGCKKQIITNENKMTLDFTMVDRKGTPAELLHAIDERKDEKFTMSYVMDGYLYIVVGYGVQDTGGYSIRVDDVYETETNIGIQTTLIGPKPGETVNKMVTYPYVVVKIENIDKSIVFE